MIDPQPIEDQVLALLAPVKAAGLVKDVVPWAPGPEPSPDDEDIARVLESLDSALLVAIEDSTPVDASGRTKAHEEISVSITIMVANRTAQEATTRGDARRVGAYALIGAVRLAVENQIVADNPGSRYRFAGHGRIAYAIGRLTWAVRYTARVETRVDPEDTEAYYARILANINQVDAPTNPALAVERDLEVPI